MGRICRVDNRLAYIDQASNLARRALGHEPVQQLVWVYDHDVDMTRLREVHRNFGQTLLGRRIERSPLPFGRHRWVAAEHQGDLEVTKARPRAELMSWIDEQAMITLDPESGPAWRMAVGPFVEGGAAVTLVVSHSVADVGGIILSALSAFAGTPIDLGLPAPGSRSRGQALREDFTELKRAVPEIRGALEAVRKATRVDKVEGAPAQSVHRGEDAIDNPNAPAIRPTVFAVVDAGTWDAHASEIRGNSGALVAAFAARLGLIMGQARPDGTVLLRFPVSERGESDFRANALTGMSVVADPTEVLVNLAPMRAALVKALKEVRKNPDGLLASLPLAPITPKWLVRRLARLALGEGPVVGCTNMGDVPDVLTQIDGTNSEYVLARGVEWPVRRAELDGIGDWLLVGSGRINGKVLLFVTAWQVGSSNSREKLGESVQQALADFGLSGSFV